MQNYPGNDSELFSLKLNHEGIAHILRFARLVKVYIIIGIIFIFLSIVNEALIVLEMRHAPDDWLLKLYFKIYPLLILIGTVIFIFQLTYFRRLSVLMKTAINDSDEMRFNNSLLNLTKIAWVVICNLILALIYSLLNLALSFRSFF